MSRRLAPAAIAILFALIHCAVTTASAAGPAGGAVERTYDVRDLSFEIPDFNDAPELGIEKPNPAPAPAARPATSPEAQTRELIALLRQVVAPADLGNARLVAERDGQLYVRGPAGAHGAVAKALEELRRRRMGQVALEAWLVRPDAKSLAQIAADAPALARKLHLASFRGGERAGTALTAAESEALRRTAGAVSAPRMTVFTGQNAYVLVATSRAYVASVVRKTGADGAEAFEGVRGAVASGVVFSGRATVAGDAKSAAVNARVALTTLHGMTDQPAPGVPRRDDLRVQVPDSETETFDVNAVAPDGGFLLFGVSSTKRPNPAPGAAVEQEPVYLILRAAVVAPRIPAAVH
jgi:hypothetical protein